MVSEKRIGWDEYFMNIAHQVAARSTCPRLAVGAVLVKDKRAISMGYNGSGRGQDHCSDAGCIIINNHCIRTVHAETNALLNAPRSEDLKYSTLYVTCMPCLDCFKNVVQAGIKRIVYDQPYDVDYSILKININQMPSIAQLVSS